MTNESTKPEGKSRTRNDEDEPGLPQSFIAMAAEGLFVVLPLIVLTIVLIQKGKGARNLFGSPEWSFAGAILMGQTVVKLVYAISSVKRGRIKSAEFMQLLAAVIIVLGLVPSLIILSLVLTSEAPSTGLIWFQILLFVLGLLVFLFFGMLTHWMVAVDRTLPPRVKGRGEEPPTRSA